MTYRILLAEDDESLREAIVDYLEAKNGGEFRLDVASDGAQALEMIEEREYYLALLDVMLPGMDGFSLCKCLREKGNIPVMFLTARGMEEDKLRGYDLGCDDYLVKPFSLAELYVRIRALLRRTGESQNLSAGTIVLYPVLGQVTVNGETLGLPRREYQLLKYLLSHQNQLISREILLDKVWGWDSAVGDRVVDNHIAKLRKHLGKEGKRIKTVIGMGYRLEGDR